MDYIGKLVRLKDDFIASAQLVDQNHSLKFGTVVDQQMVGNNRYLLVVDDEVFGTWRAVNSNIDVLPTASV